MHCIARKWQCVMKCRNEKKKKLLSLKWVYKWRLWGLKLELKQEPDWPLHEEWNQGTLKCNLLNMLFLDDIYHVLGCNAAIQIHSPAEGCPYLCVKSKPNELMKLTLFNINYTSPNAFGRMFFLLSCVSVHPFQCNLLFERHHLRNLGKLCWESSVEGRRRRRSFI